MFDVLFFSPGAVMPTLTIDGRTTRVPEGATLLDAARSLGVEIPTLCHRDGHPPQTSCMVCLVRVDGQNKLVPACATVARDGMKVESETDGVRAARRTALELLLGDHLGDCIAPCHVACPAHLDIPRMLRQLAADDRCSAIATVKERIPLPAVLGRICPAPCEKACRRGAKDAPVSICLLKRYVADVDLERDAPYSPTCAPATGRQVAVVGAGPAGLSAAYYLLRAGMACIVYDAADEPGGTLRTAIPEDRLPRRVLDAEAATIASLGGRFATARRIDAVADLMPPADAVVVATGEPGDESPSVAGIGRPGVFVAGGASRPMKMAVRAVADGRDAAAKVEQFLTGKEPVGVGREYSCHVGRVDADEIASYMVGASEAPRVEPAGDGFTADEARRDARRCLHCDCREQADCRLRDWAERYGARPAAWRGERRVFEQQRHEAGVIYEPGKCIACGLCVQITQRAGEELGLTFVGRGFKVKVAVPFDRPLDDGLRRVAAECVRACPTGALTLCEATAADGPDK
jgi:ferredoxin